MSQEAPAYYPALYKYGKATHIGGLASRGSVRVGTLHEYRNSEHVAGVHDPEEGTKVVHFETGPTYIRNPSESPAGAALKAFGADFIEVNVRGSVEAEMPVSAPDLYIYCLSMACSVEVMSEFEGADACAEVFDLQAFMHALTFGLNKVAPVKLLGASPVEYTGRREPYNGRDWGLPPILCKEQKYGPQQEVRIVWQALHEGPLAPRIFQMEHLVSFVRSVDDVANHATPKDYLDRVKALSVVRRLTPSESLANQSTVSCAETAYHRGELDRALFYCIQGCRYAAAATFSDLPECGQKGNENWLFCEFLRRRVDDFHGNEAANLVSALVAFTDGRRIRFADLLLERASYGEAGRLQHVHNVYLDEKKIAPRPGVLSLDLEKTPIGVKLSQVWYHLLKWIAADLTPDQCKGPPKRD